MIQLTNTLFVHRESPHELDNDQSLSCESKEKSPLDKRPWTADCGDLDHSLRKFIFFAAIESLDMRKSLLFRTCSYLGMTCLETRCPKFPATVARGPGELCFRNSRVMFLLLRKLQSFDATERLARAVLLRHCGRPGSGSSGCPRRSSRKE